MSFNLYLESDDIDRFPTVNPDRICNLIDELDCMVNFAVTMGDQYFAEDTIFDNLAQWLFGEDDEESPIIKEKKLLLMLLLEKASKIDFSNARSIKTIIDSQTKDSINYGSRDAYITVNSDEESLWYINSTDKWSTLHRLYLYSVSNENEFMKNLLPCFLNLSFHENVRKSLRTLNHGFRDLLREIIQHLEQLNNYHEDFKTFRQSRGIMGYQQLADKFTETTGIRCGPQSSRKSTVNLYAKFINSEGSSENIKCELHTKFSTKFSNPEEQDRLYFHEGQENIENGKVLIFQIGDHA